MKSLSIIIGIIFLSIQINGQKVINPAFDNRINELLSFTIPTITVSQAASLKHVTFLDAREIEEYQTSHIEGALHIGYDNIHMEVVDKLRRDEPIVVYCSIGYRSEKIGEKLKKEGFTNVKNLYGSLFEWANCNMPMYNSKGIITDTIHTYSKSWSQWVDNPAITKKW
jgi:rhodanese-related sulfurtransferase